MRSTSFSVIALTALGLAIGMATPQDSYADAALDLVLVVDGSGSISTTEFTTQVEGYAQAFEDAAIAQKIQDIGGVRVTFVAFATSAAVKIGWTLLETVAESTAFGTTIRNNLNRSSIGSSTAIARGLDLANDQLVALGNQGLRAGNAVIDVSGDGQDNVDGTTAVQNERNRALNTVGVDRINGLVVGGGQTLVDYYQNNVIGGTNSFVVQANDFGDFGVAVRDKIDLEIQAAIPEPATIALSSMGLGAVLLVSLRRQRRMRAAA